MNIWTFFWQTSYVGKVVVLILILMSLHSWYLIILNYLKYRHLEKTLEKAEYLIENCKELSEWVRELKTWKENSLVETFKKILTHFKEIFEFYFEKREVLNPLKGELSLSLAEKELEEKVRMEEEKFLLKLNKGLGFLATTGNVAPFIGLFGTVWGIMQAFHEIGLRGSASLATVAPGIAEALINTAMGLFCAIPAVMAYNAFLIKRDSLSKKLNLILRKKTQLLKRNFEKTEVF